MFANSLKQWVRWLKICGSTLFILLVSASLLLQFRISEMKTARPLIPSFATVGMAVVSLNRKNERLLSVLNRQGSSCLDLIYLDWTDRPERTVFPDSPGIFCVRELWTSQQTSAAAAPLSVWHGILQKKITKSSLHKFIQMDVKMERFFCVKPVKIIEVNSFFKLNK